jgi:antitoxin (DNA-binding transcriptional repressor) of toxin-antitoxin stability system
MAGRRTGGTGRRIDVSRLPDDVVELIAALAPGEDLLLTRAGEPIATITAAGGPPDGPLEGVIIRSSEAEPESAPPHREDVTVVATAMKLSETVRASLSAELGADYIVLDIQAAPHTADVLLVHPISPQLLDSLRSMFPAARVIVAEVDDPELGVSHRGPVGRLLNSGAEAYLASTTVPSLARQLDRAVTRRPEIAAAERSRLEIEPPV